MTHSDSAIVESGPLDLVGVWIHDPDDPEDTSTQYMLGKAARSTGVDTMAVEQIFAGREFPVYEYGEHQKDTFSITVNIAHGTTWYSEVATLRAFMEAKKTLHLRDNRGRSAFGVIQGYAESDQRYGTSVSFSFVRVSRAITEAA